ncbi:DUF386 family protein [Candidatus Dojkabacteria bacterium]|nr:DUF386 family protein [Candidatus Dojkabacteria bacterium]
MILDNIQNLNNICERLVSNDRLIRGLRFIESFDVKTPDGRVEIDGDDIFANVATAKTHPPKARFYETHKEYIDIQYVFRGKQKVYWLPLGSLGDRFSEDAYEPENELYRFNGVNEYEAEIVLGGGNFAVFYPEDAHKCLCRLGDCEEVRVCVVKVRL